MACCDPVVTESLVDARHDSGAGFRWGPVLLAGLGVLVALVGFAGARLAQDSKPVVALMFLTLAVGVVILLAGSVAAALPRRSHHLRVRQVAAGLEVVGSPWPQRSGILAALVIAAGAVAAVLDFRRGADVLTPTVLLVVCAVGSSWAAVRYLLGRRPVDRVTLDRGGFTATNRGRDTRHGWGDVSELRVGKLGLVVEVHEPHESDAPPAVIPIAELRSDPFLAAELLEFYRLHERFRGELSSGAALDRVRQGTFRADVS